MEDITITKSEDREIINSKMFSVITDGQREVVVSSDKDLQIFSSNKVITARYTCLT